MEDRRPGARVSLCRILYRILYRIRAGKSVQDSVQDSCRQICTGFFTGFMTVNLYRIHIGQSAQNLCHPICTEFMSDSVQDSYRQICTRIMSANFQRIQVSTICTEFKSVQSVQNSSQDNLQRIHVVRKINGNAKSIEKFRRQFDSG